MWRLATSSSARNCWHGIGDAYRDACMPHALVAQRMQHAYAALASAWPLSLTFSTLFIPYEYCSFCLTGRLPDKAHIVHRHAIPILEIKYVDWTYPVRPMSEHWSRHCGPCLFMSTTAQDAATRTFCHECHVSNKAPGAT